MKTAPAATSLDPLAVLHQHIARRGPLDVRALEGEVRRVDDAGALLEPLHVGDQLAVGAAIWVGPAGWVDVAGERLTGGRRGRAHVFLPAASIRVSPGRRDVPKLLRDLEQLESQLEAHLGEDPLSGQRAGDAPYERAVAADHALQNLQLEAARALPESIARELGAVCLYVSGESAAVAVASMRVSKVRALMQALDRPVNPHMVPEDTLLALLDVVYGRGAAS